MIFVGRSQESFFKVAFLVGSLALLSAGCWGPLGLDVGGKLGHKGGGATSGNGGSGGASGMPGCGSGGATGVDISKLVVPGAPAGACLLEYNTALVAPGADPCCSTLGGPNRCDLAVQCNDQSGGDCCLLYATDNITFGSGCCRYETGRTPFSASGQDVTAPCNALLAAGR